MSQSRDRMSDPKSCVVPLIIDDKREQPVAILALAVLSAKLLDEEAGC